MAWFLLMAGQKLGGISQRHVRHGARVQHTHRKQVRKDEVPQPEFKLSIPHRFDSGCGPCLVGDEELAPTSGTQVARPR